MRLTAELADGFFQDKRATFDLVESRVGGSCSPKKSIGQALAMTANSKSFGMLLMASQIRAISSG